MKASLSSYVAKKALIKEKLKSILTHESKLKAEKDYHARRAPRPCGLTVHVGLGCPLACTYCYIEDMGFSFESVQPYALRGSELVYALLCNPYFVPGLYGTYLAFGSISDPFLPAFIGKTLEYINSICKYLGNPIQLSTKIPVKEDIIKKLAEHSRIAPINILITLISLKHYKALEPRAPTPDLRLKFMSDLSRAGLKATLFLRPVIPGLSEDYEELLRKAKAHGAASVVVGGLRVTHKILERLERAGLNTSEIKRRLRKIGPLKPGNQYPIFTEDIKKEIIDIAKSIGLQVFKTACCANTYNIFLQRGMKIPCFGLCYTDPSFCVRCSVRCWENLPEVEEEEVSSVFAKLFEVKIRDLNLQGCFIDVYLYSKTDRNRIKRKKASLKVLETIYRRKIRLIT